MKDKFGIDSHKLMYHPCRVCDWLQNKEIFPILVNINAIDKCNHRCIFCGYNYTGHNRQTLDKKVLCDALSSMKKNDVKAVVWSGTGEPLLHPHITDMFKHSHKIGLENGLETNGVLLNNKINKACADNLSWIKFSVDAGTPETHYKVHRGKKDDFQKIIKNIKDISKIKRNCVIGVQMLLLKENEDEVETLLSLLDGVDYDYFSVKPFTQNPFQDLSLVNPGDINKVKGVPDILLREYGFEREDILSNKRDFDICYGINFFSNIDCNGNVTMCNTLFKDDKYVLGNIYKDSFEKIWKNRKIRSYSTKDCGRYQCRMDKQNVYLCKLKNPQEHVNFI